MPEWWRNAWGNRGDEQPEVLVVRLVVAALLGVGVAVARTLARSDGRPVAGLRTTLLLLTVLTALVTEVIGNNTARAFGLAGVLAVVRFRTVVEDTRDSTFVIFALAVGMAVGAGFLTTALVGFAVIAAVTVAVTQFTGPPAHEGKIVIRLKGKETSEAQLRETLSKYVDSVTVALVGSETVKEADTVELTFRFRSALKGDLGSLIDALKSKSGVEKVTWDLK